MNASTRSRPCVGETVASSGGVERGQVIAEIFHSKFEAEVANVHFAGRKCERVVVIVKDPIKADPAQRVTE